ncbi:class I SAM-dependent methyltransferase [Longimicrobium sp.]|jgi:SAM-dependent methyltransferase|uniref:class I SAM-dependent methyltransferase n=1 Tax=Longimicrobium sp. TaxID=2029185 RepID=UPI002ED8F5CA
MGQPIYDTIGIGYSAYRRPDPRIAAQIADALGTASTVLNVGAGAGSYEPADRRVAAVEPSGEMIRQRLPGAGPAVRAYADHLPFRDGSFDAALAVLTIHHWPDWRAGLQEMRRSARDRVVILTWDPEHPGFWLVQDYFPEIVEMDLLTMPAIAQMESVLGPVEVRPVFVPADCTDGFLGGYWRRPERYLDDGARGAISAFAKLRDPRPGLERLRADLADGSWNVRHGYLLARTALDIGYRLIVASAGSRHAY